MALTMSMCEKITISPVSYEKRRMQNSERGHPPAQNQSQEQKGKRDGNHHSTSQIQLFVNVNRTVSNDQFQQQAIIILAIVAKVLPSRSPLLDLRCLPICSNLVFHPRAAVCGFAAQTLLRIATSLHLLLIVIFQARN